MRKALTVIFLLGAGGLAWYFFTRKGVAGNPVTAAIEAGSNAVKQMTNPGIRNNNPLNIKWTANSRRDPWVGQTGESGKFVVFSHPVYGFRAGARNLRTYAGRGINTIAAIIKEWAPGSDNNDVKAYTDFVSKKSGMLAFTPVQVKDYANILHKMAIFETGKDYGLAMAQDGVSRMDSVK